MAPPKRILDQREQDYENDSDKPHADVPWIQKRPALGAGRAERSTSRGCVNAVSTQVIERRLARIARDIAEIFLDAQQLV
ncbi:MAG TPA: hypothetical protein VGZ01_12195, partial [Trinickia sp.]|nr:hypothetical protein [Trinickia sp.]